MKTKTLEKFEVLNSEMLASVEGGKIGAGEAAQALAVCTVAGGTIGSVFPGVGTAVGAILGGTVLYRSLGNYSSSLRRLKRNKYEEYTESNNNNADIYYINYYSRNVF